MTRKAKPIGRLSPALLLALLPTALMLFLLNSLLRPDHQSEDVTVIEATLIRVEPAPSPAPEEMPTEPQEPVLPANPVPRPTPLVTSEQKPAPTIIAVTPVPDADADETDSGIPTVDWWQAMDRFLQTQRNPEGGYAELSPTPPLPQAIPNEPAFDPKEGWYNDSGELVRNVSEYCRAEQRDAIRDDGFVPPPTILCKQPPALVLPLRRPRYLDNDIGGDNTSDNLPRFAFGSGKNVFE